MTALVVGFGLGFLVAAQLGPISLLAIRSTLRNGVYVGLAIGGGVAVIDTLYAAAGAAGAAGLLAIEPLRLAFGLVGAVVLAVLGARTLWSAFRIRMGGESHEELATPRAAFVTALAATASNPLTIASWAAVFAAASTAGGRQRRAAARRRGARQPHLDDDPGRRRLGRAPLGRPAAAAHGRRRRGRRCAGLRSPARLPHSARLRGAAVPIVTVQQSQGD